MSWRCGADSNTGMVNNLKREKLFTAPTVEAAMLAVDRKDFCDERNPYDDCPATIGHNATISAPHMHATALERLSGHLVEGARALDVGSGSGYLTACMALMCGVTGKVVGIDHVESLVKKSRKNLEKHHSDLLSSGRIELVVGDGREGVPVEGGYNAIHVGAAAYTMPNALLQQLADGGRMILPLGDGTQEYVQVDRVGDTFKRKTLHLVTYVPLTDLSHQLSRRL